MSYLRKIEYEIVPTESFTVIRGCSGCGGKTYFKNTKKFRVNANGSKLDVWLIYQCEKCKHTFNLTIYERQSVSAIPKDEYSRFQDNDEQLAEMYGRNLQLFRQNRAEVDSERMYYQFVKRQDGTVEADGREQQIMISIHNPCGLKIRPEKQIAGMLGLSRNQVQKMMQEGEIELENISPQFVSFYVKEHLL